MSTTLTNGLKLPDKGSVDWYADMQSNYTILDGAVGTIAEHTSQIAGKAPAVHTHTKSQITDFPALAAVATSGEYSDLNNIPASFTPSSHTHGNITNDGKVGTTANMPLITGTGGAITAGAFGNQANTFCEGNDSRLSDARTPIAHTHTKSDVTDLLNSNFIPSANNSYDLGSSIYQWNNLYAKNYFYNGVAWGLDKNNKWLTTNLFYGSIPIFLRGSDNDIYNVSPQSLVQSLISFVDKNNTTMSNIVFQHRTDTPETHRLCIRQQKVASDGYYGVNLNNLGDFYPDLNNTINLGTSTNKWKSFNGLNPGALSFPRIGTTANTDYIDVSGNIDLSTTASQTFTAPATGWFCISFRYNAVTSCRISAYNMRADCVSIDSDGFVGCYIPVTEGVTVTVRVNATAIYNARIYLCQGNV